MCIRDRIAHHVAAVRQIDGEHRSAAEFNIRSPVVMNVFVPVSYTHLRAHETVLDLVCRLLLEKKKQKKQT